MRITFLFPQNQTISGHAIHFEQGETADIPDIEAQALIEGLCAEPADKPVEVKPKRGKGKGNDGILQD